MSDSADTSGGTQGAAPIRRAKREEGGRAGRRKKKGLPALLIVLLFGAAPAALAVWYFLMPPAKQQAILDKLPEGTGGRAVKAGICLAVLFGLAKIALPAFHGAGSWLQGTLARLRTNGVVLRVLLFPFEFVVYVLWVTVKALFAIDAVLIVAASLALLVLVARILKPDLFASWLPEILH